MVLGGQVRAREGLAAQSSGFPESSFDEKGVALAAWPKPADA